MNSNIDTILFDLGGVLIDLDGPPIKEHWLDTPLSYEENWNRWGSANSVIAFETGKISASEFVDNVIQELNLRVTKADFISTFSAWPTGFFNQAVALLDNLKGRYTLAYYSNTNVFHLPRLIKDYNLNSYFDYCFASYEIGYFKPDIKGYKQVAKTMNKDTNRILFLDDNAGNVKGAIKAGMQAAQVQGLAELKHTLNKLL